MAVVAFTSYSTGSDCSRVNTYIADGHGLPAAARSNRYISDGHGGVTQCLGHLCPSDPVLATAYMELIRWNYDRQHSYSKGRTKGHVTHVQLYVSPTEEDHVPPEERMVMTRELIERTVLRDFPSIYIPHDNTDVGHCHISLCPYSLDGSHKLCMNNKLLYDLRREMDRICVEHGYSIIEAPELWGDKGYRDWFLQIKAEGKITIHPPRERKVSPFKKENKRARDFVRSKQAQARKKHNWEQFCREMTASYTPEHDAWFYTSEYLYHPADPAQPMRISRLRPDNTIRGDLEVRAAALAVWAHSCTVMLEKKSIPGTSGLAKRMHTIAGNAVRAMTLFQDLDIRTQEELILHRTECGQDIGSLKRHIAKQESTLQELQPIMDALDRWQNEKEPEAFAFLRAHDCTSSQKIASLQTNYQLAMARKEHSALLLEERSKEYRKLKAAEITMDPTYTKEAWGTYLEQLFSKNNILKAKRVDPDVLEGYIYELADVLGVPGETIDTFMINARGIAEQLRYDQTQRNIYREYRKRIFRADELQHNAFRQYGEDLVMVQKLWELRDKAAGFGLLGFLLTVLIETWAEMEQSIARDDLQSALWLALAEKLYAQIRYRKSIGELPYYQEVINNTHQETLDKTKQLQMLIHGFTQDKVECTSRRILMEPFQPEL